MNLVELVVFLVLVSVAAAVSGWLGHLLGLGPWVLAVPPGIVALLVSGLRMRAWMNPAVRHERRGEACLRRADYDCAIQEFSAALSAEPKLPAPIHLSRGIAYALRGDCDRAIADYDQALALEPDMVAAYLHRGQAYQSRHDNERARADFTEAIARFPNYGDAYLSRAAVYEEEGQYAEALADLDQSLLCPGAPPRAYYRKGVVHESLGELQRALEAYLRFIRVSARTDPNRERALARTRQLRGR